MKEYNWNTEEIRLADTDRLRLLGDQPELGLVIDLDQVFTAHGAVSEEQRQQLMTMIQELPKGGEFTPASWDLEIPGVDYIDSILFNPEFDGLPMSDEEKARFEKLWGRLQDQARQVQVEIFMRAERRKVEIINTPDGSTIKSLMKKLSDDGEYVVVSAFSDTLGYIKGALDGYRVKNLRRPSDRQWDQPKLRRGNGHNKLKRRGKK